MATDAIAAEFVRRYQGFWNAGAHDLAAVYTGDAVLCGLEIVRSREQIGPVLDAIVGQGWTTISIEVVQARRVGEVILLACRYTAQSAQDAIASKSSYVLVESDGCWKIAMHTAL